jgi:L-ribulokinase
MFGWFVDRLGRGEGATTGQRLAALEEVAGRLAPGQSGLLALDWWNGNRSVLGDADLSGAIFGLTLQTSAPEIYRALLEAVAFGNRAIIENFLSAGIELERVVACGGIAEKSPLLMQLVADSCGLPVTVPASSQVPARGSALFGAVAAGPARGGFASIEEAASALRPGVRAYYQPRAERAGTYSQLYGIWKDLHDQLGRQRVDWLHGLKKLKLAAASKAGARPGQVEQEDA